MQRRRLRNGILTSSLLAVALFGVVGCGEDNPAGPGDGGDGGDGGGTAVYQTITTVAGTGLSGLPLPVESQVVEVVAELESGLHHLVPGDDLIGMTGGATHERREV